MENPTRGRGRPPKIKNESELTMPIKDNKDDSPITETIETDQQRMDRVAAAHYSVVAAEEKMDHSMDAVDRAINPSLHKNKLSLQASSMAIDLSGNIYIIKGHQVIKIDANGNQTILAGNGTAGSAGDGNAAEIGTLHTPVDIAIGPENQLFILCAGDDSVRVVKGGVLSLHCSIKTTTQPTI